jgi:hypothetical protein
MSLVGQMESKRPVGRKIGNACVRSSGRSAVSDCRRGLIEERMAMATLEVFRMRFQAFCDRFGRDPEPDEPLFFDPAQDQPVAPESSVIRAQIMAAATAAKVDARLVMDFMRISGRSRAMESAGNPQRRAVPERDRVGWLPGVPEEPST